MSIVIPINVWPRSFPPLVQSRIVFRPDTYHKLPLKRIPLRGNPPESKESGRAGNGRFLLLGGRFLLEISSEI
jgi:hypothetical protein